MTNVWPGTLPLSGQHLLFVNDDVVMRGNIQTLGPLMDELGLPWSSEEPIEEIRLKILRSRY